jgi:phosphatidylglycerophosphate synthase
MTMAAYYWVRGDLVTGMLLAWLMTFLDTVDGKLARVTVTSSKFGDKLDHWTDVVHPPIWWVCLAVGLAKHHSGAVLAISLAAGAILAGYVLGRIIEVIFKLKFGYNPYLWQRFDSAFRLIVSRRNIILLIMTAGLLVGAPVEAFIASAVWTAVSVVIQVARLVQAMRTAGDGELKSWLM